MSATAPALRPKGRAITRIPGICCPDCDTPALSRTSKTVTSKFREVYYQCPNAECSGSFVVAMEIIRRLSMPARPREGLNIPYRPNFKPHDDMVFVAANENST